MTTDTQILQLSDEDFENLFSGSPEGTVNANTIVGGKEINEDSQELVIPSSSETEYNIDEIFSANNLDDNSSKEDKSSKEIDSKKNVEIDNEEFLEQEETSLLKNLTDFYIENGTWKDFEGREDFEYTNESFQKLIIEQNEQIAKEKFESLIEDTGIVGKSIIEYIQKGGNPEEIIDLFKEQKEYLSFDTSTEDKKIEFLKEFYKDVHNFKPEKIKKLIDSAILDDELDSDVEDAKEVYKKNYDNKILNKQKEIQEYEEIQKQKEADFSKNVIDVLSKNKDLTEKEKKELAENILYYDQALPDGTKVNKFYIKFAEMQNDINSYLDFVQFVMNKEKYINKIQKKTESATVEKNWLQIKRNQSVSSKSGSSTINSNRRVKEPDDFNFFSK